MIARNGIQRRYHSKVRTGCQTCKTRRIKCGEEKPSCARCVAARRDCVYKPLRMWLFERETQTRDASLSTPQSLSTNHTEGSDVRALLFFRECTIPSLSTFSKFTKQFWNELVPQLSETESAVRYMTIALATRQELLSCPPDSLHKLSQTRTNALSASVRRLTQPTCGIVTVLMCGLFFIGYECLQDPMQISPETSGRHLWAGLRILEEHHASNKRQTESASQVIHNYIEPMYLQMEMIFSMFQTPIHTSRHLSNAAADAERPKLPPRFTDLQQARAAFFKVYRWHYHYRANNKNHWTPSSPAFHAVRSLFLEWYTLIMAYNDTLSNTAKDTTERQLAMTIVSQWSLLMVGMVHSTASATTSSSSPSLTGSAEGVASPYPPYAGASENLRCRPHRFEHCHRVVHRGRSCSAVARDMRLDRRRARRRAHAADLARRWGKALGRWEWPWDRAIEHEWLM